MRKNFEHSCDLVLLKCYLRKNINITATVDVLIHLFSLTVASKQKIKMEKRYTVTLSYHSKVYSKQRSPIFLMLGSWNVVFISMFLLSPSFSDNCNLIILVDIQRLHENSKWVLCASSGVYILFKNSFLAARH